MRRRIPTLALVFTAIGAAAALGVSGCGDDGDGGDAYGGAGGTAGAAGSGADAGGGSAGSAGAGATTALARPSRSSTIAISNDDETLAMTNLDDGSVSIFRAKTEEFVARVATGGEPSSVVISPDGKTAYVTNRADATLTRVDGIDGAAPSAGQSIDVGSEPTGVALSPTGAKLFVAEHAESRISVIDTATMSVEQTIAVKNPFALAVTNDLDLDDSDETLVVPEFFGEPVNEGEAKDTGRTGRVRLYSLGDYAESGSIALAPVDSGFAPADGAPTVMTAPNQLTSVVIQQNKIYVTSISASPAGPVKFNVNVQPVVYVADLATATEDKSNVGTANLARVVKDAVGDSPMLYLADLVDMAFIGDSNVAYVLSRGADAVQRLVYEPATGIEVGSTFNKQIDVTN
ncbi:MAG: YncE family protein, partial [Lysobacterales bacterium]